MQSKERGKRKKKEEGEKETREERGMR